jgi:hypothetical protein
MRICAYRSGTDKIHYFVDLFYKHNWVTTTLLKAKPGMTVASAYSRAAH